MTNTRNVIRRTLKLQENLVTEEGELTRRDLLKKTGSEIVTSPIKKALAQHALSGVVKHVLNPSKTPKLSINITPHDVLKTHLSGSTTPFDHESVSTWAPEARNRLVGTHGEKPPYSEYMAHSWVAKSDDGGHIAWDDPIFVRYSDPNSVRHQEEGPFDYDEYLNRNEHHVIHVHPNGTVTHHQIPLDLEKNPVDEDLSGNETAEWMGKEFNKHLVKTGAIKQDPNFLLSRKKAFDKTVSDLQNHKDTWKTHREILKSSGWEPQKFMGRTYDYEPPTKDSASSYHEWWHKPSEHGELTLRHDNEGKYVDYRRYEHDMGRYNVSLWHDKKDLPPSYNSPEHNTFDIDMKPLRFGPNIGRHSHYNDENFKRLVTNPDSFK